MEKTKAYRIVKKLLVVMVVTFLLYLVVWILLNPSSAPPPRRGNEVKEQERAAWVWAGWRKTILGAEYPRVGLAWIRTV